METVPPLLSLLLWPLVLFTVFPGPSSADQNGLLLNPLPLHPLSPLEKLPQSAMKGRTKRQAYQVYLGGESSVSVEPGQVDSGPWTQWTTERECSRTCGGGVLVQRRRCDGACTGPSVRYVSCNVDKCPADSGDFRAEQCAAHNDDPLDGKYYKWAPYAGKNKCELTCRPEGANFYYKFEEKVVDGTRCDAFGEDICVDGICLPVGCDGKLGSEARRDKCGVCQGDGSQCKTVESIFDERNASPGYHDIVALPLGATAIHVEELRPTSNVFAIKNATGQWLLNGNFQIQVLDKNIMAGGTAFKYEKGDGGTEKLTANGPLQESITVALLLQQTSAKSSAVKYEYSVPLEKDVKLLWKPGEWSGCSVSCGKGIRTRALYCVETASQSRVDDEQCESQNSTKPEFEKPCKTVDCEPEWFVGDWESCSATCGDRGLQFRVVYCQRVFADGRRMTVPDGNCTAKSLERPQLSQPCGRWSCPGWNSGPWSACSSPCGDAKQFRSVTCRSEKEGEEGKLLSAEACGNQQKPSSERDCNLGPCEGLHFHSTDWELCQRCNETEERRTVTCRDQNQREYLLEKCVDERRSRKIPEDVRPCASQAPCDYEWHSSQWSKCSTECGHGHRERKVFCAINELGQTKRVDEFLCAGTKPTDSEECVNEEKCTGTFFTGPWSDCSVTCGGGTQSRAVVCLNYDRKPVPEWCDEKEKPVGQKECNPDACPKCEDSEFGCCPDGATFASGPFLAGCSNCSLGQFGCCSDNVTEAQGPKGRGCPDYVEEPSAGGERQGEANGAGGEEEGSGEEPAAEAVQKGTAEAAAPSATAAAEMCHIESEATGEKLQVPCSTISPPTADGLTPENLELAGPTAENGTENGTSKHCAKSEFGCCPDWQTPAQGPNLAGCPEFVLGNCNGTKFGCCPDGVTLARGSDFEGCGEPTCAASLFGCCRDRKTIAFGPHYAGCERSSFPCELSEWGCCADGQTAALDRNGTGCGATCLLGKWGCCPDGKTAAKGPSNEGCGCEFAQYGCCPDGRTTAKGPAYYGCPDTCAQSKFGCCPDGRTTARGPAKEGCPCQYSRWGCCPDGETTALGPKAEGCDDCRYAKYGCCADGETKAAGPDMQGCPSTTQAPYILGGTVSPNTIVACAQPQDQGEVCQPGYKLAWFYDMTEGRCSQFWFGGCAGNENRFNSKEQCEQICVEPPHIGRCYLPKVEGPQRCSQLSARYWYDFQTKQCSAFWWRGCLGNANNFGTWEECQNFCANADSSQVHLPEPPAPGPITPFRGPLPAPYHKPIQLLPTEFTVLQVPGEVKSREVCNLRLDVGKCEGHFDSWYYEVATGQCERFTYSGCGGNANRFNTMDECQALCVRRRDQPAHARGPLVAFGPQQPSAPEQRTPAVPVAVPIAMAGGTKEGEEGPASRGQPHKNAHLAAICEAPKDSGSCKQYSAKWYYDKQDGTCSRFHYGGCEGNANRFETDQECIKTCGEYREVCLLPRVTGPCAGKIQRFYFDFHAGQCLPFEFSGCLGNSNNFRSVEDCRARCQQQEEAQQQSVGVESTDSSNAVAIGQKRRREIAGEETEKGQREEEEQSRGDSPEEEHKEEEEEIVLGREEGLLFGQQPELCELPEERGNCFGEMLRYRFEPAPGANDCLGFLFTGCGHNANNFLSYEQCARACLPAWRSEPICALAPDNGTAAGGRQQQQGCPNAQVSTPKWYFDLRSSKCALFLWSGCAGNGNRFQSKSECENLCLKEAQAYGGGRNACEMPMDAGPCGDFVTLWYFDTAERHCRRFTFGGCRGNANRFVSREDCEANCVPKNAITSSHSPAGHGPQSEAARQHHQQQPAHLATPFRPNSFSPSPTMIIGRPRIFAFPIGVLKTGISNLTLKCVMERPEWGEGGRQKMPLEEHIVSWFKNNRELRTTGEEPRARYSKSSVAGIGELQIIGATVGDEGWYACAWGNSHISEPVSVKISEDTAHSNECMEDRGPANVCRNVRAIGLCSTVRYGEYCCRTCLLAA